MCAMTSQMTIYCYRYPAEFVLHCSQLRLMHKCKDLVLSACLDMNNVSVCVDAHTIEVALSLCYRLMLSRRHGDLIKESLLHGKEGGNSSSMRRMPLCYRDEFARATAACCVSIALKFCQSLEEPMQDLWNWLRSGHGESGSCQSFSTWDRVRVSLASHVCSSS
jgi:hypothetical protein